MGLVGIFIKNKTLSERTLGRRCVTQGFRQFYKVADKYLKAPDAKCFWRRKALYERRRCELPRGVWGVLPQEIFKYSWVARDVTKDQTKKLSVLLSFYFHEVLQYLNVCT